MKKKTSAKSSKASSSAAIKTPRKTQPKVASKKTAKVAAPKSAVSKSESKAGSTKKSFATTAAGSKKAAGKVLTAKPVVAEVVYENVGPAPLPAEDLQSDKVYALPVDEEPAVLDEDVEPAAPSKGLVPSDGKPGVSTSDPLAIYLNDIRKYPVLSKEKELEIAKKYYETKDPEAAQTLIKSNLRFVVKVAADYSRFGAKMIDLIQEGNVGLMHAVREYNPYKGARLITYAVWWIRGYIQEYLMRQYSMVRIGTTQNQRRLFYQLQKEKEALDSMGQEPNLKLLSSRLGIPEDEIEQMSQRMSGRDVSLDRPMDDESGASLMDLQRSTTDMNLDEKIAYEEQLEILKKKLETLRPELSEREKIILDERILNDEPLTLQEIGEKHGITREAVRQMEVRVLKKIKTKMESDT